MRSIYIVLACFFMMSASAWSAEVPIEASGKKLPTLATNIKNKLVNINVATEADLMHIIGMTKSKAKSLISYRSQNGNFKTLDELSNVKGFKRLKAEKREALLEQMALK